ncbi:MAG: tetratricopeptide repeat protein [Planctomycetota bacterium]|nr:tetratricopeptide repeat protein [Planctomycetota bacterium]
MSAGARQNSSSANRSLVGETLAGCEIRERVNQGAMGTVYKGYDQLLQEDVSITVIHPRLLRLEGFLERLRYEIEDCTQLPGIYNAGILRYELLQPWLVVVSRYIEGTPLRQILTLRGRLSFHQALWVAQQTLNSLAIAHIQNRAHKDIKPENILVTSDSELYLVGWGLLRIVNATTRESISSYGSLYGTPEYMAPDQITLGKHDSTSDMYSVGITLFELLTGTLPFQGNRIMEILKKQIVEMVPSARHYDPSIPAEVDELIQRLTAKDPSRRPESAEEAAEMIEGIIGKYATVPMHPILLPKKEEIHKRATQRISPVTATALKALAERMQNSADLGMLAFEPDDGEDQVVYAQMPMETPLAPASTQTILNNALNGDVHQALQAAIDQNKTQKVVPELLEGLFDSSRFDEILNLEEFLRSILPNQPTVPFYVGLTLEKKGDYERANTLFKETLDLAPHHLPASLHRTRCLTELSRVDEAETVLEQAINTAPSSEVAAAKYAEFLYVVKGDASSAIPAYQKAIRLAPNRLQLRKQLGWILIEEGFFSHAEAVLQELIEWSGNADLATPILNELNKRKAEQKREREEQEQGQENQEDCFLAVEFPDKDGASPKGPKGWLEIREKYLNIPVPEVAPGKKKKRQTRTKLEKIQKQMGKGNFRRAAELALMALSNDPQSIDLLLSLGRADFELGEYQEAIKVYRYILKLQPENDEARTGLSAARMAKKQEKG